VPDITLLSETRTVFINSAVLKSRLKLIKSLSSRLGPKLKLIFRDLDPPLGIPASASPDFILSPKAALFIDPLQGTTQRSLPGHRNSQALSAVHARLRGLAESYENVVVVLTHASNSRTLDAHTCATLDAFTSFATATGASCKSQITVTLAPSPITSNPAAEDVLCNTVALLISSHPTPPTDPVSFLEDTTTWEIFLVKAAGLNPFAAQVVLGLLKKSEDVGVDDDGAAGQSFGRIGGDSGPAPSWRGLTALLAPRQRMAALADVIGAKAVERLNLILDASCRGGPGRPWPLSPVL